MHSATSRFRSASALYEADRMMDARTTAIAGAIAASHATPTITACAVLAATVAVSRLWRRRKRTPRSTAQEEPAAAAAADDDNEALRERWGSRLVGLRAARAAAACSARCAIRAGKRARGDEGGIEGSSADAWVTGRAARVARVTDAGKPVGSMRNIPHRNALFAVTISIANPLSHLAEAVGASSLLIHPLDAPTAHFCRARSALRPTTSAAPSPSASRAATRLIDRAAG